MPSASPRSRWYRNGTWVVDHIVKPPDGSQSAIATIVPRQAGVTKLSRYVSSTTAAALSNARSASPWTNRKRRWCAFVASSSCTIGAPGSSAATGSKTAGSGA